jgi:transposase
MRRGAIARGPFRVIFDGFTWANIPPKSNRAGDGPVDVRFCPVSVEAGPGQERCLWPDARNDPICFSPFLYRARNRVERFFNRIKQCRRVATRYDKLAANYLA